MGSPDHAVNGISKKADWYLTQLDRFRQFGETGEAKEIRPNLVHVNPAYLKASRLIIVNIVNGRRATPKSLVCHHASISLLCSNGNDHEQSCPRKYPIVTSPFQGPKQKIPSNAIKVTRRNLKINLERSGGILGSVSSHTAHTYSITVEDGEKKHSVRCTDLGMTKELRELISSLSQVKD